jgi:hypothetical protein
VLLQIATWVLLFAGASGIGRGLLAIFRKIAPGPRCVCPGAFAAAWFGVAAAVGVLEVASLVTRIGTGCIVLLSAVAIAGLPLAGVAAWRSLRRATRRSAIGVLLVLGWIAIASYLVALGANEPVGLGDTCSTHIQQVKWARDYGAVIGLGNLNSKLAFDQSAHLLAALLDRGVWRDRSVRVAVPFFLWLALVEWAVTIARPSHDDGDVRAKIFCGLTLPYLIGKTQALELPSFSGDLPMACVALALAAALLRLPSPAHTRVVSVLRRQAEACMVIASMAALLITIKLSGAMLLFLAFAVAAASTWTSLRTRRALIFVVPALLIAGMLARRVLLSGWLLFPFPIGNLHLPWSVPSHETIDQYTWIRSWARLPDHSPGELAARGFWFWFVPWLKDFGRRPEMTIAFVGAALATIRLTSGFRRRAPVTILEAAITLSIALSIAYWFIGAPDVRFGGVFIWMFAAAAAVPFLATGYHKEYGPRLILVAASLAALLTTTGGWLYLARAPAWTTTQPTNVNFPTRPFTIENGVAPLEVYVPSSGRAYCGDSPLPCTPFPAQQRLRRPGMIGSGFLP